jgi:multisubunit Na+/H+ antiporter MnhB subunit
MKNYFVIFALGALLIIMVSSYAEMPRMGNPENPSYNEVSRHYLERSSVETRTPNVIANIIMDYRALDTLGEATVLFTSIAAVLTILTGKDPDPHKKEGMKHG